MIKKKKSLLILMGYNKAAGPRLQTPSARAACPRYKGQTYVPGCRLRRSSLYAHTPEVCRSARLGLQNYALGADPPTRSLMTCTWGL